ncbi:MAG: hypothetical protein GF410_05435 [Chitinivibrionales bacterium]|nr:hypothetical protein [Chitinivibrionales bacterium]
MAISAGILALSSIVFQADAKTIWVSQSGALSKAARQSGAKKALRTLQAAADIATAGDTVMIAPGRYAGFAGMAKGTRARPVVYRSEKKWGAVIESSVPQALMKRAKGLENAEIKTRASVYARANNVFQGMTFENTGYEHTWTCAVYPMEPGVRVLDCRFRNLGGFGMILDKEYQRPDSCHVYRSVFEDLQGGTFWSKGKEGDWQQCNLNGVENYESCKNTARFNLEMRVIDHRVIDCVWRRCNKSNISTCCCMGANKYLYTKDMVISGLVSYDHNGAGWWADWDSWNYLIEYSTFFGNHAGTHPQEGDCHWGGVGLWTEGNDFGSMMYNVFYSNLYGGVGILDNGFANTDELDYNDDTEGDGKVRFIGNVLVDNPRHIEFRFALKAPRNHRGGPTILKDNVFKSWKTVAWQFGDPFVQNAATPEEAGWEIDGNIYDNTEDAPMLAEWTQSLCNLQTHPGGQGCDVSDPTEQVRTPFRNMNDFRTLMDIEHNGSEEPYEFRGPLHPMRKTSEVGLVPSGPAEENHMRTVLNGKSPGDEVTIPVSWFKRPIVVEDGAWVCTMHDLQANVITVRMDDESKEWVEKNVRFYGSTGQTEVTLTLNSIDEYEAVGTMGTGKTSGQLTSHPLYGLHQQPRFRMLNGRRPVLLSLPTQARVSVYTVGGRAVGTHVRAGIDGTARLPALRTGAYIARIASPYLPGNAMALTFAIVR